MSLIFSQIPQPPVVRTAQTPLGFAASILAAVAILGIFLALLHPR